MATPDGSWPLAGILRFAARPGLWFWPVVANLLGLALALAAAIGTAWACWPGEGGFWHQVWRGGLALGLGAAAGLAAWILLLPPLVSLSCEAVVRRALRERGIEVREPPLVAGLTSTLHFMLATLHWRLGWTAATLVAGLVLGPFAVLVGWLGLAHIAVLDACDTALALRGHDAASRLRRIRFAPFDAAVLAATLGAAGLSTTILLWPLFAPGLHLGAARWAEGHPPDAAR